MPKPRRNLSTATPLTVAQARQRHANIADAYFSQAPTLSNLYNGSVNWLRSKGILEPENTGMITGAAPVPGRTIPVANRVESARQAYESARKSYGGAYRVFNDYKGSILSDDPNEVNGAISLYDMLDRAHAAMMNRYRIYRRAIVNTAKRKKK